MLEFAGAREAVRAKLERNVLIRPRSLPDGHGELNCLEIEEISREFVGRQISGGIRGVEVNFARQRVGLDATLAVVKKSVRNVAQITHAVVFDQCLQFFRPDMRKPTHGVFGLWFLALAIAEKTAHIRVATVPAGAAGGLGPLARDFLGGFYPALDLSLPAKGLDR